MNPTRILCIAVACLTCIAATARAQTPPPPTPANPSPAAAAAEIDAILAAEWKVQGLAPNEPLTDEAFARRVYLDLAGRIPTPDELAAFLRSTGPDRRGALVDALLARESYVSNFYNLWADVLRFKTGHINRSGVIEAAYERFIKESLRTNKPYDRFVREMLSAKGFAWDDGAIGYYHRDPEMPLDNLAITTRVFLGTRIECAQCHNHPFDKWTQTEFYRLAAFTYGNKPVNEAFDGARAAMRAREQAIDDDFRKEKAASADGGKAAAERKKARLEALDNRGITGIIKGCVGQLFSPIGLRYDGGAVLKLPHDFHEADGKPFEVMRRATPFGPPAAIAPGRTGTEAFADWVASPKNERFTRVIVNRLWKRMFGVALIEPLDELRDDMTAMVPALEERLERLMVELRYDMRAFLAVVARTRAYQSAASRTEFARGSTYHFQGPVLRRMTAEQVWDSVVALASHDPDGRDLQREAALERRINVSRMACEAYLSFDGTKLLEMAYARLAAERELQRRELAVKEALVVAKRAGDKAKEIELRHQEGDLDRERGQTMVRDFILPILTNLARQKVGPDALPVADPNYKMNANPRVLATETWKRMHLPGYGPMPKTPAELAAERQALADARLALAAKLGVPEPDRAAFAAYCERADANWRRASELDSPAPRGHFLRTMGQSDRDFVENANPAASIPQALLLMNGDLVTEKNLLSLHSPLMVYVGRAKTPEEKVEAVFLAILSRKPTAAEKAKLAARSASVEDVVYALMNTKQFMFVQ